MPRDVSLIGTYILYSVLTRQPSNISFGSDDPGQRKAAAWKDVKRASCHADAVTFINHF